VTAIPEMNDREAVLQTEREWVEAHLRLDLTAIARIMADEYVIIGQNGTVITREQALASYRNDRRRWEYARSDELDVRLYGDTAVVIGRWTAKGENNGNPFDYSARFMSVYVRRSGRWQMAAEQSTPIRP
jgi:ketosteroid isomerase-like protein